MERREPVLGDVVFYGIFVYQFLILVLLVLSGLVFSSISIWYCSVRTHVILVALRLVCGFLRPPGTWFGLGGLVRFPFGRSCL